MVSSPHPGRSRARRISIRARASLALGLLTAALAVTSAWADVTTPIISGLRWRSGATTGGFPCLADLRGRALDAVNVYLAPPSFAEMVTNAGAWVERYGAKAPLLVVSMALLPAENKGQFAQCASGTFDNYFRQIGANLQKTPAQGVVVRLGWEANLGSKVHPWGVDTPDQVPLYKSCWRRAAVALKAGGPVIKVEWTNSKKTNNSSIHVLDMNPGDDVVDLWGVHYYDAWPLKNTQPIWDAYYLATYNNGPWGLGTWLAAAKLHQKKLGVAEWGIKQLPNQSAAQADDPVYMDNMYRFFSTNAADIAYETYFNGDTNQGGHALCPNGGYPNATAVYQKDWGLGR